MGAPVCRLGRIAATSCILWLAVRTLDAQVPTSGWPQWRGPSRNGAIETFTPPARWPAQMIRRWTVDVGLGYASPVVVGDRVFMFGRRGEDEVLAAFQAESGAGIWVSRYPAPYTVHRLADGAGPGPKSTPVFSNGKLFTLGISGILSAFDAETGRVVWQKPAPAAGPTYTTSQSPLIDSGLLIAHVGGYGNGALTAFDPETGAVKWEWKGDGPAYGSPVVAELGGTRQVVTFTENNLVGVSAATGELLWIRPFKTARDVQAQTPLIHRGMVIVTAFESGFTAIRAFERQGTWVTEDVWKNDEVFCRFANGVIVGDTLFSLGGQRFGQWFYLDARTGHVLWRGDPRAAENAAISHAGSIIFALKDDGELLVIDGAATNGLATLARYQVANTPTWSQPAIVGSRIFVKDESTLALWTID
jgi:outer membrane protein assembly factor BamB